MKKIYIPTIMAVALAMGVTSCNNHGATNVYRANQIGVAQETVTGVITSIQPVKIEGNNAAMGTAIGGVAGGLGGALLGGGSARYATTAGGVVAGSLIGNQIDQAVSARDGLRISVRLDDTNRTTTIVQEVDRRNPLFVGQRVRVMMGGNSSRIMPL